MNERTIDDILSDFANASVECEAVQLGMSRREHVMRADECRAELSERFAAARREVETAALDALTLEAENARLRAALEEQHEELLVAKGETVAMRVFADKAIKKKQETESALKTVLENVRRIETFAMTENGTVEFNGSRWVAEFDRWGCERNRVASAVGLVELGRALAQEADNAT